MSKNTYYNKKNAIVQFQKKYKVKFDMDGVAIDTRTMAENYPDGIIPLNDIAQAIDVVLGPNKRNSVKSYDPTKGIVKFDYVAWTKLYLWPRFQRDVSPNHLDKILQDWDHTSVIVPTAIKIKDRYMLWDGHHTDQGMYRSGYTLFPVWYVDVDLITEEQMKREGFDDKIEYAVWLAGKNMIRINSRNKRPLHPYDEFMIMLETKDPLALTMMNILQKNNCVPKRHPSKPGAWSQIKSGMECYNLEDAYGNKGMFWDRALKFHRDLWPMSPLVLEMFRPMTMLYHRAALNGKTLDAEFDKELGDLLIQKYGDPDTAQSEIKDSYWTAVHNKTGQGVQPEHDKERVLNGLICLYNDNVGRLPLPPATYVWKV